MYGRQQEDYAASTLRSLILLSSLLIAQGDNTTLVPSPASSSAPSSNTDTNTTLAWALPVGISLLAMLIPCLVYIYKKHTMNAKIKQLLDLQRFPAEVIKKLGLSPELNDIKNFKEGEGKRFEGLIDSISSKLAPPVQSTQPLPLPLQVHVVRVSESARLLSDDLSLRGHYKAENKDGLCAASMEYATDLSEAIRALPNLRVATPEGCCRCWDGNTLDIEEIEKSQANIIDYLVNKKKYSRMQENPAKKIDEDKKEVKDNNLADSVNSKSQEHQDAYVVAGASNSLELSVRTAATGDGEKTNSTSTDMPRSQTLEFNTSEAGLSMPAETFNQLSEKERFQIIGEAIQQYKAGKSENFPLIQQKLDWIEKKIEKLAADHPSREKFEKLEREFLGEEQADPNLLAALGAMHTNPGLNARFDRRKAHALIGPHHHINNENMTPLSQNLTDGNPLSNCASTLFSTTTQTAGHTTSNSNQVEDKKKASASDLPLTPTHRNT